MVKDGWMDMIYPRQIAKDEESEVCPTVQTGENLLKHGSLSNLQIVMPLSRFGYAVPTFQPGHLLGGVK